MNASEPMSGGRYPAMPPAQCLDTRQAIEAMAMSSGRRLLNAPVAHVIVLAAYAGALIAAGALFSVLLSAGVETQGPRRLLEGLGYSAGFFFVILSQSALFTEINVVMPVTLLHFSVPAILAKAARFWTVAFVANFAGALAVGYLVATVQHYPPEIASRLEEIVPANMAYFSLGAGARTGPGWTAALARNILPAALGNILGGFLLVVVPFWICFGS